MCNYCKKKELFDATPDVYIEGNILKIEYSAISTDSEFYDEIGILFCPFCGEKLIIE